MNRATLWKYLGGGLAPDERSDLEDRLAHDPVLAGRLGELRQALDALGSPPTPPRWAVPPPAASRFGLSAGDLTMGASTGTTLLFEAPPQPAWVVVLWDRGEGWELLFPATRAEAVRTDELPTHSDGRHMLDLVLPEGDSGWALLLPEDLAWPDPWEGLRDDLFWGKVLVASVDLAR